MSSGKPTLAALGAFLCSGLSSLGVNPVPWTTVIPPDTSHADSIASKTAMIKVSSIIIPQVEFKKADVRTVLSFLRDKSKQCDPEHIGVRFELESPPLPVEAVHNWPNGYLSPDGRPLVDETLPAMTLECLLGFVAHDTDLRYKFVNGVVVLSPVATEQERRANKAMILSKLSKIILPKIDFENADIFEVLGFLNDKSKDLDPDHLGINFQAYVPYGGESPDFTRTVTVNLHDVPLNDVLSLISKQTKLEYTVTSGGVFFTEPGADN